MKYFEAFFKEEIAEFDWFSEEKEAFAEETIYSELEDLRAEAEMSLENSEKEDNLEKNEYSEIECMDEAIEAVNVPEIYFGEELDMAMKYVFSDVKKKLCGRQTEVSSGLVADYIDEIRKNCEVFFSELHNCTESEVYARISQCLAENGCVITAVDNGQWEDEKEYESIFMDDGMRILEVIGIDGEYLIINDYGKTDGRKIQVSEFIKMNGLLLEVLK